MSEEGKFDAVDSVELAHAMTGIASAMWTFFSGLLDEGFSAEQAIKITTSWAHGMAGGKLS